MPRFIAILIHKKSPLLSRFIKFKPCRQINNFSIRTFKNKVENSVGVQDPDFPVLVAGHPDTDNVWTLKLGRKKLLTRFIPDENVGHHQSYSSQSLFC